MAYLHRGNILHRDLKADNCLVARGEDSPAGGHGLVVKVGDFGTAVEGEESYLVKGVGTPLWSVVSLALSLSFSLSLSHSLTHFLSLSLSSVT